MINAHGSSFRSNWLTDWAKFYFYVIIVKYFPYPLFCCKISYTANICYIHMLWIHLSARFLFSKSMDVDLICSAVVDYIIYSTLSLCFMLGVENSYFYPILLLTTLASILGPFCEVSRINIDKKILGIFLKPLLQSAIMSDS